MYTVILYVGNSSDINRYRLWLRELEAVGKGRLMQSPSLDSEVAKGIAQVARRKKNWSLIIVYSGQCWVPVCDFLNYLQAAVDTEKNYLLHMPDKVWLAVKRHINSEQKMLNDHIAAGKLPVYCRLVEYIVDMQDTERWLEDIKLLCIIVLLALNEIPSENLVVYRRHCVDVDIDTAELAEYVRKQKAVLCQGMELARQENRRLLEETPEHDVEAVRDIPEAIAVPEFEAQYVDEWGEKVEDRNKAFFGMLNGLSREGNFVQQEVLRGERYLRVVERELSEEDKATVLEKKQRDEIEMIQIMLDKKQKEYRLRAERIMAEKKVSNARLFRWDIREGAWAGVCAFGFVVGIWGATAWELHVFDKLNGGDVRKILGLASGFGLYVIVVMLLQNKCLCKKAKKALNEVWGKMKLFEEESKRKIRKFGLLCCRIRKRQTLLWGHRLAERVKAERIKNVQMHYYFCKNRLAEMEELECFLGEGGVNFAEKDDRYENRIPDFCGNPEKDAAYRLFSPDNMREIPVGMSGKAILCPFSFVKSFSIKRDFSQ